MGRLVLRRQLKPVAGDIVEARAKLEATLLEIQQIEYAYRLIGARVWANPEMPDLMQEQYAHRDALLKLGGVLPPVYLPRDRTDIS